MTTLVGFFLFFVGWYNFYRYRKFQKTGVYSDPTVEFRRDENPRQFKFFQGLLWLASWAMTIGGGILVLLRLLEFEIIDGDF